MVRPALAGDLASGIWGGVVPDFPQPKKRVAGTGLIVRQRRRPGATTAAGSMNVRARMRAVSCRAPKLFSTRIAAILSMAAIFCPPLFSAADLQILTFPIGLITGEHRIEVELGVTQEPADLSLDGKKVCVATSSEPWCAVDFGPAPHVHLLELIRLGARWQGDSTASTMGQPTRHGGRSRDHALRTDPRRRMFRAPGVVSSGKIRPHSDRGHRKRPRTQTSRRQGIISISVQPVRRGPNHCCLSGLSGWLARREGRHRIQFRRGIPGDHDRCSAVTRGHEGEEEHRLGPSDARRWCQDHEPGGRRGRLCARPGSRLPVAAEFARRQGSYRQRLAQGRIVSFQPFETVVRHTRCSASPSRRFRMVA